MMVMALLSGEGVEEPVHDCHQREQDDDAHDRRQVERPEPRQEPPEEAQIRLADVAQELRDSAYPGRVGQPHPRDQDVDEDQQDVDVDEDVYKLVRRRRGVREQRKRGHQERVRLTQPKSWPPSLRPG